MWFEPWVNLIFEFVHCLEHCSLYPHSSCSKYPLLDVWRNISSHSACSAVWEWSESDLFSQCRCVAGRSPLVSHPLSCPLSWILRLSHFSVVSFPVKVASSSIVSRCTHLLPFHWSFWSFSSELLPGCRCPFGCGRHACTQYSKSGLTRLLYKAMMFLFDLFSYVRLISPTNLFALLTHVAMWWLGLSDWLITTPRSFSSVECAIFCAPIVQCSASRGFFCRARRPAPFSWRPALLKKPKWRPALLTKKKFFFFFFFFKYLSHMAFSSVLPFLLPTHSVDCAVHLLLSHSRALLVSSALFHPFYRANYALFLQFTALKCPFDGPFTVLKCPFDGPFTALKCPFQMAPCPFENLGRTLLYTRVLGLHDQSVHIYIFLG